eukprot:5149960-Prorocentrum_lima.AAC.1
MQGRRQLRARNRLMEEENEGRTAVQPHRTAAHPRRSDAAGRISAPTTSCWDVMAPCRWRLA